MIKEMILNLLLITLAASSQILSQQSLAVTIYNDDFAMVKDVRKISFDKGESTLYFTDVSSNIQTQTVTFKALNDPTSIRVYQQNYEANLVDTSAILKKYIQKKIDVVAQFGGQVRKVSGILLAQGGDYILKTNTGVIVLKNIAEIDLPALPQGFFTVPTLNWKVFSNKTQNTSCEVAYRTTGFSWKADYSLTLNNNETKGDIGGWVTIDNNSGKKYVNAKLKLIAGEVNVVKPPQPQPMYEMMYMKSNVAMAEMADSAPTFSQKSFADYHLYTLSAPVTLNQSSQKQVEFIPKVFGVKLRKYNQVTISAGGYSQQRIQAQSKVQFNNSQEQGMGVPLPKGIFRVFKEDDSDKSLQFIGEDSINHTPKNQNLTLTIGKAFDVTTNLIASKRQTFSTGGYTASLSLTITNHKDVATQVQVIFNSYYGDNLMIDWAAANKFKFNKDSASVYKASLILQPDEKVTLNWDQSYHP